MDLYSLLFSITDCEPSRAEPSRVESSRVKSYITTDAQSASLSCNKAPIWDLRPDFYYCRTVADLLTMGSSLWREDGSVVYNCCWSSPAQSFSGPSSVGLATIFYSLRFETSLFVASCDSQVYSESIRPRLHTDRKQNTHSSCSSVVICVSVAKVMCIYQTVVQQRSIPRCLALQSYVVWIAFGRFQLNDLAFFLSATNRNNVRHKKTIASQFHEHLTLSVRLTNQSWIHSLTFWHPC
jgi:hypothetical protein